MYHFYEEFIYGSPLQSNARSDPGTISLIRGAARRGCGRRQSGMEGESERSVALKLFLSTLLAILTFLLLAVFFKVASLCWYWLERRLLLEGPKEAERPESYHLKNR